jgi:HemY protein
VLNYESSLWATVVAVFAIGLAIYLTACCGLVSASRGGQPVVAA